MAAMPVFQSPAILSGIFNALSRTFPTQPSPAIIPDFLSSLRGLPRPASGAGWGGADRFNHFGQDCYAYALCLSRFAHPATSPTLPFWAVQSPARLSRDILIRTLSIVSTLLPSAPHQGTLRR